MDFLQKVYLGNTTQNWLVALFLLVVVFTLFIIFQRLLIRRLAQLAKLTANEFDDMLVEAFKNTKLLILIVASAYVASNTIVLPPTIASWWGKVVMIVLIMQGGFWLSASITFFLRRTIQKRSEQDSSTATTITFLGFLSRLVLWVIVLLLILDNVGVNITGLVAGLGIGGIAVALAVQNILGDLLASLSIVLDKPFVIGDFVVVDSLSGTIEHIGLKTTRIRSINGEQLIFSNTDLLKSRIRNFKRMSERRVVFGFGVVYQTPVEKLQAIKRIVRDIIEKQENARFDRVHFKEYGDSSLNFEVVYYVPSQDFKIYMDIQEAINLEIFRRFAEAGIEFAYPTRTLFVSNGIHYDRLVAAHRDSKIGAQKI
jgi:small-conductance mechanosensitive channel